MKQIKFVVFICLCFSMYFFTGQAMANNFLTLPLENDFSLSCEFACYTGHQGSDYSTATEDHTVVAAYNGIVVAPTADNNIPNDPDINFPNNMGNVVYLDHGTINGKNVKTIYAHLLTGLFLVNIGDSVKRGQPIAKSGNSGTSTNPHLHFEVRLDNVAVDPYNLTDYLWTTNPPSHGYFTPATYFDFKTGSQGWTPGFDAQTVAQTQGDTETWMIAADNFDGESGTNLGVVSPSFSSGIDTGQFRTLKFSARVDGSGGNSPGYVYIKDNSGNWNHSVYFGSVPRDYLYHEYEADLTQTGSSLPISQFSIELTENGGYEHWIFDWVRLISGYDGWDFTDNALGWTIKQYAKQADFFASDWWRIEPTGKQPQIVSPHLYDITSNFIKVGIRYSVQNGGKETARVYFDTGNGFSSACYDWKTITHNGFGQSAIFDIPPCAAGKIQRIMFDLFDNADYANKLISINKISFLKGDSTDDADFKIAAFEETAVLPPPIDLIPPSPSIDLRIGK